MEKTEPVKQAGKERQGASRKASRGWKAMRKGGPEGATPASGVLRG